MLQFILLLTNLQLGSLFQAKINSNDIHSKDIHFNILIFTSRITSIIYQTRERVFYQEIKTPKKRIEKSRHTQVF